MSAIASILYLYMETTDLMNNDSYQCSGKCCACRFEW